MMEVAKETPTFCMSYEMLLLDPEPIVKQLFCFLLDVDSVEGTLVGAQIEKVTRKGHADSNKQAYKLKADTGKLFARRHFYTDNLLSEINRRLRDYMFFWGYAAHPDLDSPLHAVTYDDTSESDLKNYQGYKIINEATLRKDPLPKKQRQWDVNGYRPPHDFTLRFALELPRIAIEPKNP